MKIYFKNLDCLHFFAAFFVLLYHAQFFNEINSYPLSSVFSVYLLQMGKMGVNLFFALIGFLISYLLFAERKQANSISSKDESVINLEYSIFRTLGKISFGIYLFHTPLGSIVVMFMTKALKIKNSFIAYDILYPILATVVTSLLAYVSYELFEKNFLVLKNRFAIIKTRI
jgi:peptidoglycan/LPS O-acetylase OafA/YrhL